MMRCSGRNRIPWVSLTVNGRPEAAIVLTAIFPGRADAWLAHSVRYDEANAPRNALQGGLSRYARRDFSLLHQFKAHIAAPRSGGFGISGTGAGVPYTCLALPTRILRSRSFSVRERTAAG